MTRDECITLIRDTYAGFVPEKTTSNGTGAETRLFGGNSPLDSMAVVSLLIEVEQQVNDRCGTQIVIADERAMSQTRSPFRTIGSLADYIQVLLSEHR